jgi:hypothetical protein
MSTLDLSVRAPATTSVALGKDQTIGRRAVPGILAIRADHEPIAQVGLAPTRPFGGSSLASKVPIVARISNDRRRPSSEQPDDGQLRY